MGKKLLLIIDNLKTGGAERVFVDIVHLINGYIQFDVLLIHSDKGNGYSLPAGVNVINLNRNNKWSLITALRCFFIIRQYSVLHVHMRHTFRYIYLVSRFLKRPPVVILHDHFGEIDIFKGPPFKLSKWVKPDKYICVSNSLKRWAIDIWEIPGSKINVLVNLPSFGLSKINSSVGKRLGGGLVLVGNIKPVKNQKFAVNLSIEMDLPLTLIGNNQDNNYFTEIVDQIKNSNKISCLDNINDVSKLLGKFQVGIFCSLSESGPLVILEYLLSGLPFVAFKTGEISEIVSKYFPEFFLDTFDINQWKDKVNRFMSETPVIDAEFVSKMLENEFNKDNYRNILLKIYE